MQAIVEKLLRKMHLYSVVYRLREEYQRAGYVAKRQSLIDAYFANNDVTALQIGTGDNVRDGFLNGDLYPRSDRVIYFDATQQFPFKDNSFDYVFSEHMIEHVPYSGGTNMLNESFRVLKPGGVARIATPDLAFLVDLYKTEKAGTQSQYIEWSATEYMGGPDFALDTFVINNFVRNWGHQFIYDEKVMRKTMESAGFRDIVRCPINQSRHKKVEGLEFEGRMPAGYLALETMVVEAVKPN